MKNHLSHTNLDGMMGKKGKDFLGQVKDLRDIMRHNLFLFLVLGLYYY